MWPASAARVGVEAQVTVDNEQRSRELAVRGRYQRLYAHLCNLSIPEWQTTFIAIEAIVGFELPMSARKHRSWWSNHNGRGHSQALAWQAAGWETVNVDVQAETLTLRRKGADASPQIDLDELWPVHHAGGWPEGLSLRREDFYEDRI